MTYVVDFEKAVVINDYCFYLTRNAGRVAVLRQPLRGDHPDPFCQKEVVPEGEIPPHLTAPLQILRAGGIPAIT